jgi:NAD(P) transhydrogenase subunit alpha
VVEKVLGSLALITATFNVVGGFAITDRMLRLFKENRHPSAPVNDGTSR